MNDVPANRTDVAQEAADWFARLQSDNAQDNDWISFEAWWNADPAHQNAFQAVEELWVDLDSTGDRETVQSASGQIIPLRSRRRLLSWGGWAACGGIAAALIIGVISLRAPLVPPPGSFRTIETAKGERKVIVLPDGTRVYLDSASAILTSSKKDTRVVRLARGQAVFNVTHNPSTPFIVAVGDRTITDVGTVFDVMRLADAVQVTVKQGEVSVRPTNATPGQAAIEVSAGRQLLHHDGDAASMVRVVDPGMVLAWSSGRLAYHDASLESVVFDLNRYFATPIRIEGRRTAELRFSGVLVLDSEDAVIGRLQAFLPVAVRRSNDSVWLRAR